MQDDRYLDIAITLPAYSSMSSSTLARRAAEGCFTVYKVGNKKLVKKSEFDAWIESQKTQPKSERPTTLKSMLDALSARVQQQRKKAGTA